MRADLDDGATLKHIYTKHTDCIKLGNTKEKKEGKHNYCWQKNGKQNNIQCIPSSTDVRYLALTFPVSGTVKQRAASVIRDTKEHDVKNVCSHHTSYSKAAVEII